jgi:Lar family restriction alleviation protein
MEFKIIIDEKTSVKELMEIIEGKLKPCPFCGSQPQLEFYMPSSIWMSKVYCHCERASVKSDKTLENLIEQWNERDTK